MKAARNPSDLYTAQRRIRHIEKADFHLTELQLAQDQYIPWHQHTATSDTFYVLEGSIRVSLLDPAETQDVASGKTFAVDGGRPHFVTNVGTAPSTFLLLQGLGKVDFVPLASPASARE